MTQKSFPAYPQILKSDFSIFFDLFYFPFTLSPLGGYYIPLWGIIILVQDPLLSQVRLPEMEGSLVTLRTICQVFANSQSIFLASPTLEQLGNFWQFSLKIK